MAERTFKRAPTADKWGVTELMRMCRSRSYSAVEIKFQTVRDDINAQDEHGYSALCLAAEHGTDVILMLLERGANPNLQDELGDTPFLRLIGGGGPTHEERVRRLTGLLRAGGDPDLMNDLGSYPRGWLATEHGEKSGIAPALREAMRAAGVSDHAPTQAQRVESAQRKAKAAAARRRADREYRTAQRREFGPLKPGFRWRKRGDPNPRQWWVMDGDVKLRWWCVQVPTGKTRQQLAEWLEEQCVRDKYWSRNFDVSEMRVSVEARRNEAALKARRATRKARERDAKKAAPKRKPKTATKAQRKRPG